MRFLAFAPDGARPVGNHESQDIRWVPLDDLFSYDLDPGTHRLIAAGLRVAKGLLTDAV